MYAHFKAALQRIVTELNKEFRGDVISVYAFGSRVRGDHSARSDFDVLVLVKDRTIHLEEGIIDVFVDEEMQSGISFDPVIKTARSFELEKRHNTPFYQNVAEQGIKI